MAGRVIIVMKERVPLWILKVSTSPSVTKNKEIFQIKLFPGKEDVSATDE